MLTKKQFQILHTLMILIVLITFILLPLNYIKYIAWIPLVIVLNWIIFNGCILDKLHHTNANCDIILTDNITPFLKLFNENMANYIHKKYLENTNRPTYIVFFIFTFLTTIISYRLIYKIDIIK
jgi:hypothetical protein